MSTKIFVLKLQDPQSAAPPEDYILILNNHLGINEFVADLQELYPAIHTTNGKLRLVLEGSYRMAPGQFLRYMKTTVAYMPEVEGGVCVPKLLGGGNGITVVYLEGLEPTQPTASRQSAVPLSVPTSVSMLAKEVDAMKIGENLEFSVSSRAEVNGNQAQVQSHPLCPGPTHENARHTLVIWLAQERSILPAVTFQNIRLENVPQSGGPQQCLWLESEILARLPEWLDRSAVKLKLFHFSLKSEATSHLTWTKDSFQWSEHLKYWSLSIHASISW